MTHPPEHPSNPSGGWADDPALADLDARLRASARPARVPDGLTDRITAASRGLLPGAAPALRLAGTAADPRPARLRRGHRWGLAAAAAVALTGGLAFWFTSSTPAPVDPADAGLAHADPAPIAVPVDVVRPDEPAPEFGAEYALALLESHPRGTAELESYLTASEASFADFAAELSLVADELNAGLGL